MALTEQKRRYAEARMSGASKKEAAIAAGCPEKTASQSASRYEKDADVIAVMGRKRAVKSGVKSGQSADNEETYIPAAADDPIEFFKQVTNDLEADPKLRLEAAKAWAAYTVAKPGEAGKKTQRQEKADQASSAGKFGVRKAPKLVVDNK